MIFRSEHGALNDTDNHDHIFTPDQIRPERGEFGLQNQIPIENDDENDDNNGDNFDA